MEQQEIEAQLHKRQKARLAQDYETADSIRDALAANGVIIQDRRGQTSWRTEDWKMRGHISFSEEVHMERKDATVGVPCAGASLVYGSQKEVENGVHEKGDTE
ncbi:MAG: hypothetical protein AB1384_12495 [Actinomycetota bacterium]